MLYQALFALMGGLGSVRIVQLPHHHELPQTEILRQFVMWLEGAREVPLRLS